MNARQERKYRVDKSSADTDNNKDNEIVGSYKPVVYVDEIGLTSDKYIPLNDTIQMLPLKISFGPLSLQVLLLLVQ